MVLSMEKEILICDRCRREVKYLVPLKSQPIGLRRELCTECVDSLKAFLWNRPDPNVVTIYEKAEKELQIVYRHGAEALEAWAEGATADQLAERIRRMLVQAKQETYADRTILGIAV